MMFIENFSVFLIEVVSLYILVSKIKSVRFFYKCGRQTYIVSQNVSQASDTPAELTQTKSEIMSVQDLRGKPPIFHAVKGPLGARLKGYHFSKNQGKGVYFSANVFSIQHFGKIVFSGIIYFSEQLYATINHHINDHFAYGL